MSSHGYVAYTHGCRCLVCRGAKAEYMRSRRAEARRAAAMLTRSSTGGRPVRYTAWGPGAERYVAPIDIHGTRFGYEEHGCRCAACTTARTTADRIYRGGAS